MRGSRVTIKDIARELSISPSTVSRALKDHPDISAQTKIAVNELARKLQYEPNAIALSLKNSFSKTLGLIIPEIIHYFFSSVISGIEDVAYDAGFNVIICQSNESYEREVKNLHTLVSGRVDGLLVSVSKETTNFDHFKHVVDTGIPIVFYDRVCNEILTDRVIVDDADGAFKAVDHLASVGCKNIVHFAASQHLMIGRNRAMGYREAMRKNNLPFTEDMIIQCDSFDCAKEMTEKLLKEKNPPDGIFAVNDLTAIGAMLAIKKAGLNIPDDIAVVGFSNGNYATMTEPSLTTVEQHGYEIGKIAINLLLDRLRSDYDYEAITRMIRTDLVVRESTKRKVKAEAAITFQDLSGMQQI